MDLNADRNFALTVETRMAAAGCCWLLLAAAGCCCSLEKFRLKKTKKNGNVKQNGENGVCTILKGKKFNGNEYESRHVTNIEILRKTAHITAEVSQTRNVLTYTGFTHALKHRWA